MWIRKSDEEIQAYVDLQKAKRESWLRPLLYALILREERFSLLASIAHYSKQPVVQMWNCLRSVARAGCAE
jgi:hypothetical protein